LTLSISQNNIEYYAAVERDSDEGNSMLALNDFNPDSFKVGLHVNDIIHA
jgi:hypothetical protein